MKTVPFRSAAKACGVSDQTVLNWHDRFTQFLFVNELDAHVSF
jgi:transposase-like protein